MPRRSRALPLLMALSLALTALAGGPAVAAAPAAPAAPFVVNSLLDAPDADLGNPACLTGGGVCTWRAALQQAGATPALDTITFSVVGTITLGSFTSAITHTLNIVGPGAGQLTIDANGTGPTVRVLANDPAGPVNISGLTLTGGDNDQGGGVQSAGQAPLILTNVVITGNLGETGGGLYTNSPTTLIDTTVSHNMASLRGGGIDSHNGLDLLNSRVQENELIGTVVALGAQEIGAYSGGGLYAAGEMTMTSSLVLSNTAVAPVSVAVAGVQPAAPSGPFGVGIYLDNTSATISNSVIAGNTALACITCPVTIAGDVGPGLVGLGGGVFAYDSSLYVVDTQILSNTAQQGGGLYLNDGNATFYTSRVAGNLAATAGGLYSFATYLSVNFSSVLDNWATTGDGGGLYLYDGNASIEASLVAGNKARGSGGGGYATGSVDLFVGYSQFERNASGQTPPVTGASVAAPQITLDEGGGLALLVSDTEIFNSAIVSNTATLGGGITSAGPLYIENSTLSGNRANRDGGGLRLIVPPALAVSGADPVSAADLYHVTLANNLADADNNGSGDGGGLFVTTGTTATLHNTLLALNVDSGGQAPACAGVVGTIGYNLVDVTAGCTISATTGDQFNLAAGLLPLQNYGGSTLTHSLSYASPARDTADPADCSSQDQRNFERPFDADCDIGAFELLGIYIPLVTR